MVCPRRCHCLTSIASPLSTLQRQKRKLLNPPLICFITEPWLSLFSTGSSEKGEGGFRGGWPFPLGTLPEGKKRGIFRAPSIFMLRHRHQRTADSEDVMFTAKVLIATRDADVT